jgi:GDP-L-fucose synthase
MRGTPSLSEAQLVYKSEVAKDANIFVAGHRGLVGASIVRALSGRGYTNVLVRGHAELELLDPVAVDAFFAKYHPEYVYLAAARVGGIFVNSTQPVDFITENLQIELNVITAAHRHGVRKLLFLGSSCIYPKLAPQPIREESLLTGLLEPTNQPYALAKIAGIEMVNAYRHQYGDRFISVMPTNLYGPWDNFDLQSSHVLPALLRKTHEAKLYGAPSIEVWGSGTPRREFLHVDDLADACLFLMDHYDDDIPINVGTGEDISIRELASLIKEVVGYGGELRFDAAKPDGTPRKLLDVSRLRKLGWLHRITLREGIEGTYRWYLDRAGGSN